MDFDIKQGDTSPHIVISLKDNDDLPINLTGFASLVFKMSKSDDTPIITNGTVTVVGLPTDGVVKHAWQTGETNVVGRHKAEVVFTASDGSIETFPNSGYIWVTIDPKL